MGCWSSYSRLFRRWWDYLHPFRLHSGWTRIQANHLVCQNMGLDEFFEICWPFLFGFYSTFSAQYPQIRGCRMFLSTFSLSNIWVDPDSVGMQVATYSNARCTLSATQSGPKVQNLHFSFLNIHFFYKNSCCRMSARPSGFYFFGTKSVFFDIKSSIVSKKYFFSKQSIKTRWKKGGGWY